MSIGGIVKALRQAAHAIRQDINELPAAFLTHDPAARSEAEIKWLYPGFKAVVGHRLAHALWTQESHFLARSVSEMVRFTTGIEIHPGAQIGRKVVIDHGMGTVIGETAVIEDEVLLYQGVTLGSVKNVKEKRHPTIRSGAVIGSGASVLGDITVGESAKVGAGSVVVGHVDAHVSVGGIPALPLRMAKSIHTAQPLTPIASEAKPKTIAIQIRSNVNKAT